MTEAEKQAGGIREFCKKYWQSFVGIAGVLGIIATIAARSTTVAAFFNRPAGVVLAVQADSSDFRVPESVRETSKTLSDVRGTMVFSIQNTGDRPAEDVALQCNYKGFAEIKRLNELTEFSRFDRRLAVGNVKVEEPITINVWTYDLEVNPEEVVTLTHSLGKQAVRFPSKVSGETNAGWKVFFAFVAILAACMTYLAVLVWFIRYRVTTLLSKALPIYREMKRLYPKMVHLQETLIAKTSGATDNAEPSEEGN